MIQLASDPNASRMKWQPGEAEDKAAALQAQPARRHAWPFISRYAEKPVEPKEPKSLAEHGS